MRNTPEFTLRRATESDRTYIQRLNYLTDVFGDETADLDEANASYVEAYVGDWDPERDGGIIAFDQHHTPAGGVWLRYWDSADALGYANLGPEVPEIAIAVENRFAGHKLAVSLLEQACDLAREQGAQRIALHVEPANLRAKHRYETFGFAELPAEETGHAGVMVYQL